MNASNATISTRGVGSVLKLKGGLKAINNDDDYDDDDDDDFVVSEIRVRFSQHRKLTHLSQTPTLASPNNT